MKLKSILFIAVLIIVSSCKHEIENPSWTVDVVAPIAKTKLKLTDLLKDSDVDLDTNSNDELLLVYRLNPIDTNLNDLIADGNLGFTQSEIITIPEFEIPDINIDFEASLGKIIEPDSVLTTNLVQGATLLIPLVTINADTFNMDAIEGFNELVIKSGFIDIEIINNLPTKINGLSMILKNQDPNNLLQNDDIINIPSNGGTIYLGIGGDTTISIELENILFTNLLQLAVNEYDFLANQDSCTINTEIGLKFNILIYDIIVSKIQGVIEESIPIDSTNNETYINIEGLNIKKAKIDSGSININFETIIDIPLQFNFYSPNIVPNDTMSITINEGIGISSIDLSGKEITFGGKDNDTVNTFYYELFGFIPAATINYDASENNEVRYEISGYIKPKYVIADVDQVIMEIAEDTFEFNFFNDLDVGSNFSIESAKITLGIENSIGVGCSYNLNISSKNSIDGNSADDGIYNNIGSASFNDITEIVTTSWSENEFPNISSIINIKPDLIIINGQLTLNSGTDNFIVYDKGISIAPNIEVPLSFIASNLVLSDTSNIELPTEINNATLNLIINNGYPLITKVDIIFLDENYIEVETKEHTIAAGKVSGDGRIYEATRSSMSIEIAEENIQDIKYVNYIASFETSSQTEYNKIYSDYSIDIQIIAKYKSIIVKE